MSKNNIVPMNDQKQVSDLAKKNNKIALNKARAIVIDLGKSIGAPNGLTQGRGTNSPGSSKALSDDPFNALGDKGKIIAPPYELLTLSMIIEMNSEIGQCVEAMETNIDATGHRFVSRLKLDELSFQTDKPLNKEQKKLLEESKAEKVNLINFFTYATSESFVSFRRKLRKDLETTGNAYFEVIRSELGKIQGFTHLPSYQMRLGRLEDEYQTVNRKILELQKDGSVKIKKQKVIKRFRTFVQGRNIQQVGSRAAVNSPYHVWFKEFGDSRYYDKNDGKPKKRVEIKDRATEVIHLKLYSPRSPYGLPRYIGNLLSIFGDRKSEEINFNTFTNNNIPSMMLLVSNGQLTQASIERIQSFVESQIQGSDNYSKFLIVEGETLGFGEEGEDGGQMKIEVKPLNQSQHNDALFQDYSDNNQDKIRRAYRLPPILVGRTKDYNKSTTEASRKIADEQVFAPERDEFDSCMNRYLFPEMGIIYHKYKSNSPNTTDNSQLVKILSGSEKTGGMTPRIARFVMEDILGVDLPEFPEDFPADKPFSLTMAEAVKNRADPTEPGQQVTAIKTLKALNIIDDKGEIDFSEIGLDDLDLENPESVADVAKKLFELNRVAESLWLAEQSK